MTDDKKTVTEPADDATVVHDELTEEQSNEKLVANVAKMLGRDEYGDTAEPQDSGEEPADDSSESQDESAEAKPVPLSRELQDRSEKAGLSKELAAKLHETGHLEETLAALDRKVIESTKTETVEKPEGESKPPEDVDEVPDLDPDIYDEAIVARDAYHKKRIDALEAKLEQLLGDRQADFDQWFDGVLSEMGYDTSDDAKCQQTFKAYCGICEAAGVSPESRDAGMVQRAHMAMFPDDVVKKTQQKTVDRLRDAEGKFLSSSKPRGALPAKSMTEEEAHDELVSNVTSYLKKQGVQMSGL